MEEFSNGMAQRLKLKLIKILLNLKIMKQQQ